jgi:hypothetical protein
MKSYPKPIQVVKKHKHSKSERKVLEVRLDKLIGDYVKKRDGKCVLCGATEKLTSGHWIHRGKKRVRWDVRNVNCLCASCNLTDNYQPQWHTEYMLKHHGIDVVLELTELSKVLSWKFSVPELRAMVEEAERLSG